MERDTPVKLAFKSFDPAEVSDKPPIVFMHGITSTKEHWNDIPQTVANATKRKSFALDARNHGNSEWSDRFDFDCMVDDLLHFLDSRKIERAILVGHSMGGIIGIKTALRKPERVEQLVVEDMYVKRVPQAQCDTIVASLHLANEALQLVPVDTDEETVQKFIVDFISKNQSADLLMTKKSWSGLELKRTENGRYSFTFNVDAVENILSKVSETLPENKGVYKGPTSFMYGGLSPYRVGDEKDHIKTFFPNAEFVELSDATHKVHFDCPKEFTEALIKFLVKE